jgi:hypothetical protein
MYFDEKFMLNREIVWNACVELIDDLDALSDSRTKEMVDMAAHRKSIDDGKESVRVGDGGGGVGSVAIVGQRNGSYSRYNANGECEKGRTHRLLEHANASCSPRGGVSGGGAAGSTTESSYEAILRR